MSKVVKSTHGRSKSDPKSEEPRENETLAENSLKKLKHKNSKGKSPKRSITQGDALLGFTNTPDYDSVFPMHLIHPESTTRVVWDVFILVVLLYTLIYLPIRIAFVDSSYEVSDIVLDSIFFIDMVFAFFSAYTDKSGRVITNMENIAYRYILGWFLIDFFSCFPFYLLLDGSTAGYRIIQLLKVVRLLRLLKLLQNTRYKIYLDKWEDSTNFHPGVVRMIKLALAVVSMGHVFSCIWIFIGKSVVTDDTTWVEYYSFNKYSDSSMYLAAIYWFYVTFATLGYGDITPRNDLERGFCIVVIILGFCVYSYLTASLASIVKSIDKPLEVFRERTVQMTRFFNYYDIPSNLQFKIRKHFRTQFGAEDAPPDGDAAIQSVPSFLRGQLAMCVYGESLKKIALINIMNDSAFMETLACYVNSRRYDQHEIIAREGDIAQEWFILSKGLIHAETLSQKCIYKLSEGQCFGEIALLNLKCWEVTLRCMSEVEVFTIPKGNLFKLLMDFPDCYEILQQSADERHEKFLELKALVDSHEMADPVAESNNRVRRQVTSIFQSRDAKYQIESDEEEEEEEDVETVEPSQSKNVQSVELSRNINKTRHASYNVHDSRADKVLDFRKIDKSSLLSPISEKNYDYSVSISQSPALHPHTPSVVNDDDSETKIIENADNHNSSYFLSGKDAVSLLSHVDNELDEPGTNSLKAVKVPISPMRRSSTNHFVVPAENELKLRPRITRAVSLVQAKQEKSFEEMPIAELDVLTGKRKSGRQTLPIGGNTKLNQMQNSLQLANDINDIRERLDKLLVISNDVKSNESKVSHQTPRVDNMSEKHVKIIEPVDHFGKIDSKHEIPISARSTGRASHGGAEFKNYMQNHRGGDLGGI